MWVRVVLVPLVASLILAVISKRGWLIGVVALIVYGGVGLGMAIAPKTVVAWERRHPVIDGMIFGPLVFLAVAYVTSWSLWVCLLLGVAGVLVGAAQGIRRARHWSATVSD
jgi:hypothetical protein